MILQNDDDVLDVLSLDSSIDERKSLEVMCTSKTYAWPNYKVSKVQAMKVIPGLTSSQSFDSGSNFESEKGSFTRGGASGSRSGAGVSKGGAGGSK
ncbi:hypothetical protein Tco_0688565 [Tanacetum coccineum]